MLTAGVCTAAKAASQDSNHCSPSQSNCCIQSHHSKQYRTSNFHQSLPPSLSLLSALAYRLLQHLSVCSLPRKLDLVLGIDSSQGGFTVGSLLASCCCLQGMTGECLLRSAPYRHQLNERMQAGWLGRRASAACSGGASEGLQQADYS